MTAFFVSGDVKLRNDECDSSVLDVKLEVVAGHTVPQIDAPLTRDVIGHNNTHRAMLSEATGEKVVHIYVPIDTCECMDASEDTFKDDLPLALL